MFPLQPVSNEVALLILQGVHKFKVEEHPKSNWLIVTFIWQEDDHHHHHTSAAIALAKDQAKTEKKALKAADTVAQQVL